MLTYGYAYAHVKVYVRGWLTRKRVFVWQKEKIKMMMTMANVERINSHATSPTSTIRHII